MFITPTDFSFIIIAVKIIINLDGTSKVFFVYSFVIKVPLSFIFKIQSPLTYLRTRDVTHFRIQKIKLKVFSISQKLGLLYIFNLKYIFK